MQVPFGNLWAILGDRDISLVFLYLEGLGLPPPTGIDPGTCSIAGQTDTVITPSDRSVA